MKPTEFQELIWQHGRDLYRDMPWRRDTNPYFVLVSELMLQQTQVDRVIPKFNQFVERFPDVVTLAEASLGEVLTLWSGLGYNRRAKFLHEAAKKVRDEFGAQIPANQADLVSLPGVGVNTAGAVLAYSFNQPVIFVETNIRTVYFHHFFPTEIDITDEQIKEMLIDTIDKEHPREWYWALMDYGSFLKKQGVGRIDQSKHYKKQAPLSGSVREIRGLILKALVEKELEMGELANQLPADDRFQVALDGLLKEGLVETSNGRLHLPPA